MIDNEELTINNKRLYTEAAPGRKNKKRTTYILDNEGTYRKPRYIY